MGTLFNRHDEKIKLTIDAAATSDASNYVLTCMYRGFELSDHKVRYAVADNPHRSL